MLQMLPKAGKMSPVTSEVINSEGKVATKDYLINYM